MLDGHKVVDKAVGIWDNIFRYDNSLVVHFLLAPCLKDILSKKHITIKIFSALHVS